MQIEFNKVLPKPLSEIVHSKESLWNSEIIFESGKRILLNASSGKGKTTFVHTLMGLRTDFSGDILVGDKNSKSFNTDKWVELRKSTISAVYQDLQLFPQLTVEENFKLKAELTGSFNSEVAFAKLEYLGLKDKWNQKCGFLSMGQQQRVAIVRALIQPFQWLVMDEPFSHLDNHNADLCMQLIQNRCDELKAGYILTTLDAKDNLSFDYEVKL
ncbi:MAG: ATP-binding cassette domain-containing protein [Crocinitomicaceae bacterium]